MAPETRYLSVMDAIGLHARLIMAMGTAPAARRDEGPLESALMRPQMAAHYESADLAMQAALLITGIAPAHPFVDGKKRTAILCGVVFLQLNSLWPLDLLVPLGWYLLPFGWYRLAMLVWMVLEAWSWQP